MKTIVVLDFESIGFTTMCFCMRIHICIEMVRYVRVALLSDSEPHLVGTLFDTC